MFGLIRLPIHIIVSLPATNFQMPGERMERYG